MKISPLPQGTGLPAGLNAPLGQTADAGKLARAKAIAAGQEPVSSGDPQVDRARESIRKIKMKTQVSTNRHDPVETPVEAVVPPVEPEVPIVDKIEAPVVEETKPLSPQVAALAKAKRALQVKERELAQREEALKIQVPAGQDLLTKLKANPLSVLQEAGVTYDQLTEAILANQNVPIDPAKLRAEIKEDLKKEILGEFGTRDQQQEQQVLGEIRRDALALTAQGDQYETIREAKAQEDVVQLIHRTWKQTGEVMDVAQAAELVENQLIDEALPFMKIKKIQSRLNPEPVAPAQTAPAPKPGVKVMRTLTNRDTAAPITDRRARAIAAMNGTLKRG